MRADSELDIKEYHERTHAICLRYWLPHGGENYDQSQFVLLKCHQARTWGGDLLGSVGED
jgi:hypothetical protein